MRYGLADGAENGVAACPPVREHGRIRTDMDREGNGALKRTLRKPPGAPPSPLVTKLCLLTSVGGGALKRGLRVAGLGVGFAPLFPAPGRRGDEWNSAQFVRLVADGRMV